jgi:hypothetical protein
MTQPLRLPYFYSTSWNMDVTSRLTNGLPGRKICGATNFETPYDNRDVPAALRVALYRDMLNNKDSLRGRWVREHIHELRGHNLFCICRAGIPCHGDVLIELANAPSCVPAGGSEAA